MVLFTSHLSLKSDIGIERPIWTSHKERDITQDKEFSGKGVITFTLF